MILLEEHDADVAERHRRPVPVANLAPERQRALMRGKGLRELALVLEENPEIVERRGHRAAVADLLARGERLLVHLLRARDVLLIGQHGAEAIERRCRAGAIAGVDEQIPCALERCFGFDRLALAEVAPALEETRSRDEQPRAQFFGAMERPLDGGQLPRGVAQGGRGLRFGKIDTRIRVAG